VTRVLSALVLLLLVIGVVVWLPPWGTLALALVALLPAVRELVHLAGPGFGAPVPGLLFVSSAAAVVAMGTAWAPVEAVLLSALVAVGAFLVGEARIDSDACRRAGVMMLPMLYLGLPLGAMAAIRRTDGAGMLLLLLATTVVSDTAQYYGGRLAGRRALAPRISPKKTIEGAASGLLVGGLVLPIAGPTAFVGVPVWVLWGAGLCLAGLGIMGDLFESLLKRGVGAKDASGLIPGHGGVLDRIDSLLFAAPFYYVFLRAIG
jgi:phosphatidate cytidylyltransferase